MRIIEITALSNGAHRNQTWDLPVPPVGYAVIPEDMPTPNFPFGEAVVEEIDGVMTVTAWTPGVLPQPEPEQEPVVPLTDAELAAALLDGVNDI